MVVKSKRTRNTKSQHTKSKASSGLSEQGFKEVSGFFQVLSDPGRLQIIELLRDQALPVGKIAEILGYPQPTVSRKIAQLESCGIIERSRNGAQVECRIKDQRIIAICEHVCGCIDDYKRGASSLYRS